jgi:hypothetical protein
LRGWLKDFDAGVPPISFEPPEHTTLPRGIGMDRDAL